MGSARGEAILLSTIAHCLLVTQSGCFEGYFSEVIGSSVRTLVLLYAD